MSGFRDTFTKDEGKDSSNLDYDDGAFYYFASTVLLVIAVPWTLNVVYNLIFPGQAEVAATFPKKSRSGSVYRYCKTDQMVDKVEDARRAARSCSNGAWFTILKMTVLGLMWVCLYFLIMQIGATGTQVKAFDPFAILEIQSGADPAAIKKAYRKLSLVYHPDKNPDDPLAANRFIQITKAYNSLTDEVAKANYEKYGNPDGPQTSKVGIGLPRFLLEKENHLMILCIFFFLLLFVVPMTFICYYQNTKVYAEKGVMIETLQFLGSWINEGSRIKHAPELFAASAESRAMETRPTDNDQMKVIIADAVEHKKRQWQHPIIVKNQYLVLAHMQRLHHMMTPELRSDCDELLKHSMKVTQAMIEIACMREWFHTAQSMIEFRRSLVQATDIKSSQLLQIPHFTDEVLATHKKGRSAPSTLEDFISRSPENRTKDSKLTPKQMLDVEEFCRCVGAVEVTTTVEVEDEKEIVVGDVATVTIKLVRKHLNEGEACGPVHAPFFPEPKFEEWWLFLVENPSTRILAFERVRETERIIEEKMRFQVSRPGKHSFVLHALSDAFVGLDKKVDITFTALQEHEAKREIIVHKEDEELDLQPTLFQQFMGDLGKDEDSEDEEDEADKAKDKKKDKPVPKKKQAPSTKDIDGSGDDTPAAKKKDDSDSSSSDSDSD